MASHKQLIPKFNSPAQNHMAAELIRRFAILLLTASVLYTASASAAIQIPHSLNQSEREETLRIVGFGTASKILSDPYPLGGYAGFEAGVSVETLPTEDIGRMGAKLATPQQDVSYPKFTIGKGLYNNLDIFFHFIPYNQMSELSQWGGLVRWGFYQATFSPLSASILVHMNNANISNLVTTRALGTDLIGGINVKSVSLYAGIGYLQSWGTFLGGPSGVTDTGSLETASVAGLHTLVGLNLHIADFFLAAELDRYTQSVLSGKFGVRF
jgi:hypothetical protein